MALSVIASGEGGNNGCGSTTEVNLIWLAGLVFVVGSLIALWPDACEQRRLVARYRAAVVGAEA